MFLYLTKVDQSAETRRNLHTHTHTHTHTCNSLLSPKQIGTICFAISFIFSAPLFATDIPSSASTADCKHTPLQVYSGTSNLEAGWQANTIQLHWYNGDTEIQNVPSASQSCVYDGTLTPPATIPTKTGYTFKGWRVRQAAQCSLSSLDATIDGIWNASKGSTGNCDYWNNDTEEWSENCNDSYFNGLNSWEWTANFSYGTIKGMAKCSTKVGNNNLWNYDNNSSNWAATDSEIMSTQNGAYCWCKATSYTPNGSSSCTLNNSSWVLFDTFGGDVSDCMGNCWFACAGALIVTRPGEMGYPNYRSAFFSVQ